MRFRYLLPALVLLTGALWVSVHAQNGGFNQNGGTGGGISGLTTGFLTEAKTATSLQNSPCDDGVTTAATITCTEPIAITGGSPGVNTPAITCGVLNTTSCVFTGYGGTSGTWNCTGPAVAGTTTNPIVCSNAIQVPSGSVLGTPLSGVLTNMTGSPTLTAPALGAATATSLLATGIVDGVAPVTITTGTTANLGGTYNSGYTLNQEATAGTGVTYTLPATATGKQYCVSNSGTTGVINTGVLTVYPLSSSYVILNGTVNTVGGGGTHGVASGGAAGDAACFVAIDATHWQVFVGNGNWAEN